MKIEKALNHICYARDPKIAPKGVSQSRWNGILRYVDVHWKKVGKSLAESKVSG